MTRARIPWVGMMSVGMAAWFAACSSSSGVGDSQDAGGDRRGRSEAGSDSPEEMFTFDQGTDSPPPDSRSDSPTDSSTDMGTEDSFDGPLPDAPFEGSFDAPPDTIEEFTEDVVFEDGGTEDVVFEDGGTEDVFTEDVFTEDVDSCSLPDADTAVFPAACASCLEESCCTQLTACEGDPGCKAIATCIGQCLTMKKTNCAVTCYDAGDAGKALASAFLNCMNESCNSSFETACQ
jgi:hypothetical protein